MNKVAIVGIGNPYRGDDGAGWSVIELLRNKVSSAILLDRQWGDMAELLDIFETNKTVFLVDACISGAAVGSWQRIDAIGHPLPMDRRQTSTHGLSVSRTIDLARNLQMLPAKLIIYAITGDQYNMSENLSPIVAIAVEKVVAELLKEKEISHARI